MSIPNIHLMDLDHNNTEAIHNKAATTNNQGNIHRHLFIHQISEYFIVP